MMFVRWMAVSLAYGMLIAGPLFFLGITGLVPTLPDWTLVPAMLGGFVLGALGPLRHMDWIEGDW